MLAFKSLNRSIEKSMHSGMYQGTGDTAVRNYLALHKRAVQLLPDDFYISDVLTLEIAAESNDRQKLSQVTLITGQMVDYLKSQVAEETRTSFDSTDFDEIKGFGRDLQDQILNLTRNTLRRAFDNVDVTVNVPRPPRPPMPPDVPPPDFFNSPVPPPVPPVPPHPFSKEDEDLV
jgi:hypothetical protein